MKIKSFYSLIPILALLAVWELATRLNTLPGGFIFPPFTAVVSEFYRLVSNGILPASFLHSLIRVLVGFTAGSIAGIVIGVLMGWNRVVNRTFHPVFSILYPIPALGWLPILMIWLGIGEILPIVIIFICSFFPVLYNTVTGIGNVDANYLKVARTLGASRRRILFTILLPMALPNIFTGLRLEAGMAWRVIIAAEMVAIPTGIGALLMQAESLIRIDIIIVVLFVLSLMCFSFERFFIFLEHRLTSNWK